jgi:hypothetical protein
MSGQTSTSELRTKGGRIIGKIASADSAESRSEFEKLNGKTPARADCGAVAFEAKIDFDKGTTRCNCSICTKSRFWFAILQGEDFKVEKGEDQLSNYSWIPPGKSESHLCYRFCKTCGVRTFAEGNGGEFYAVAIATLDGIEQDADQLVRSLKFNDGRHDDLKHAPADTRLL